MITLPWREKRAITRSMFRSKNCDFLYLVLTLISEFWIAISWFFFSQTGNITFKMCRKCVWERWLRTVASEKVYRSHFYVIVQTIWTSCIAAIRKKVTIKVLLTSCLNSIARTQVTELDNGVMFCNIDSQKETRFVQSSLMHPQWHFANFWFIRLSDGFLFWHGTV